MVGRGSRRDDGVFAINSTNIFAALESRKKKKRSDNEKQGSALPTSPPAQAWTPAPISVTSWADCEEDDDEYFVMPSLPPLPSLDNDRAAADWEEEVEDDDDAVEDEVESSHGEESERDDDEEPGNEENKEPQIFNDKTERLGTDVNARIATREPDRQLSKKELKKKGLAELEATLVELGLNQNFEKDSTKRAATKEVAANVGANVSQETKGSTLSESKSSKRRKAKKEKSTAEGREEETLSVDGASKVEPALDTNEATGPLDRSELLKKLSSMKKKKSKDGDSAAKAAAAEAAVRAAKLAAAKKKEKNHYNQQPAR